jgi:molybdate transport system substrate-binding protein
VRSTHLTPSWIALALTFCLAVPSRADTLHVFAAASLTDAFSEIGHAFESVHPGTTIEFNFAGSQVLRTQIEQGAQADVFASADRAHADALRAKELLEPTHVFIRNRLVVVTPIDASRIKALVDLARPGRKIVTAGPTVPAGRYTLQVLRNMAGSGLYGDDYPARVQANVVSQEPNVQAVLGKVAMGEADAGFVYRTDAKDAKVRVLDIPDRQNVIAEYPIGVVAGTRAGELAKQFVAFVDSPEGQAILQKHGFMN